MTKILALLFALITLPALAADITKPDPDALIIKHTEDEVANNPAVKTAKEQVTQAFAADNHAKNDRAQLNQQMIAATEKYREESRQAMQSPEEYQKFLQSHQQRFDTLNNQMRTTSGVEPQSRKQLEEARKQMRLVIMEARVDNPAFPVYQTLGTAWEEEKETHRLVQHVSLRDSGGKHYSLATPQAVDKLSSQNCSYFPVWGEIWAVRGAEVIPPDPKAPATAPVQLKIASLKQIYLMDHAASATCPFGQVLMPAPKEQ